jgi:hypothetical protein
MAEQRVVKRKTHTKSRKGCFQCKQRHTKVRHLAQFFLLAEHCYEGTSQSDAAVASRIVDERLE